MANWCTSLQRAITRSGVYYLSHSTISLSRCICHHRKPSILLKMFSPILPKRHATKFRSLLLREERTKSRCTFVLDPWHGYRSFPPYPNTTSLRFTPNPPFSCMRPVQTWTILLHDILNTNRRPPTTMSDRVLLHLLLIFNHGLNQRRRGGVGLENNKFGGYTPSNSKRSPSEA